MTTVNFSSYICILVPRAGVWSTCGKTPILLANSMQVT